MLLERYVKNSRGLLASQRSYVTTVKNHYARDCRQTGGEFRRKSFHASTVDTEKKLASKNQKESTNEQEERPESYLISALSSSITSSAEIWLVDNGASRYMMGYRSALSNLKEKKFSVQVKLGDPATYEIKGVGSASF